MGKAAEIWKLLAFEKEKKKIAFFKKKIKKKTKKNAL